MKRSVASLQRRRAARPAAPSTRFAFVSGRLKTAGGAICDASIRVAIAAFVPVLLLLVGASPAAAFEAVNGRLQAHGYYEMQMRVMSADFNDQWDMTQWYNVLNVELEFDLVQQSHGPVDLVSMFVRVEGRFDCIYSRGCGTIQGVDAYGDRSRRLPGRLQGGEEFDHAGSIFIDNVGPLPITPERNPYLVEQIPGFRGIYDNQLENLPVAIDRGVLMQCQNGATGTGGNANCSDSANFFRPGRIQPRFWQADRQKRIAGFGGVPIDDGTSGTPYLIAMEDFRDFKFTSIPVIGGSNSGFPNQLMGPWLPENFVTTSGALANLPNPLDFSRVSPQSLSNGVGANPMRPIPIYREDFAGSDEVWIRQTSELNGQPLSNDGRWEQINPTTGMFSDVREWNNGPAAPWQARGAFTPSPQLKQALIDDKFTEYPFNISETDRAFNRGASQSDEGELKEAYFDIEMFDSRLWLRLGKQSIVWGKTELFRTTDQFNPQDFALATLPSLEESRIALWALRGVYSFYEVGPLADVRLELAMNFDQFESADLGACGEPYAVNLICSLTFGSWAHGITGIGVAGFTAPPDPWDDAQGIEFGGRIEWRWDRYSFALSDFYGYSDFPHPVRLGTYSRNVDWRSGRPRYYMHTVNNMANAQLGCATPVGSGVTFATNPVTGGPDFTVAPTGAGSRITFDSAGDTGCLTPGASNRQVRVLQTLPGTTDYYGVPYRVPTTNAGASSNDLQAYAGVFLNNTSRSDPNDPRQVYSQPTTPTPTSAGDWPDGPQASACETNPLLAGHPGCTVSPTTGGRGRRTFDTTKFIVVSGQTVPNPTYNPFYDPRMDPYLDPSAATNANGGVNYFTAPGNVIASSPVLFDPFKIYDQNPSVGHSFWANAYDPTLEYDQRNSLDISPVNLGLFNFICATTVGFSDLDPSACALTVFSSPKQPGGSNAATPRIATVISAFMSGSGLFNGFLGKVPTDDLLSKGPLLPDGMGIPLAQLHADVGVPPDPTPATNLTPQTFGQGLNAFRTTDQRRQWADRASGTLPLQTSKSYPWIYSFESESYNCLPPLFALVENSAPQLCGGLAINEPRPGIDFRYRNVGFLSRTLSPQQEALLGCGPLFGTSCDSNGADFLWAEGSALLQSFIGADSLGIAFADVGIQHLVSADFGSFFMDNNDSPSQEFRTDGRVLDYNGNLIRIDGATLTPSLGSDGYLTGLGNMGRFPGSPAASPCDINTNRIVQVDGSIDNLNRASARCWDLRRYLTIYGSQPGTAAFEIMGLGGPKCTTADIGGPLDPKASVLPGCRNKWDTIQFRPLASWDGTTALQPNNPDAGYIGNNWYQQVFSYKQAAAQGTPTAFNPNVLPTPRSDYRQWSADPSDHQLTDNLAYQIPCGTGTGAGNPGSPADPQNYDCYLNNPTAGSPTASGRVAVHLPSNWTATLAGWEPGSPAYQAAQATRRSGLNWGVFDPALSGCDPNRSAQVMQDDPSCYLGGWNQGVDGDPDRLGVAPDSGGGILYPTYTIATNGNAFDNFLSYGDRVENGCTPGTTWMFLQRTSSNQLLSPPECAQVFVSPNQQPTSPVTRWPNDLLGGTGHPFTGESFSSEVAGISNNLMNLLVTFSSDFTDGLASVRGFVNPELYESRFIYDEEWMWNPDCEQNPVFPNPNQKTLAECGGRGFIRDPTFPSSINPQMSAYGDPNRDPNDPNLTRFNDPAFSYRIRQAFTQSSPGVIALNTRVGWQSTGLANVQATGAAARQNKVPNPLPAGTTNRLQRDPSLPNILTTFPDLLMRECNSARRDYQEGMTPEQIRSLYENCGTIKPAEPAFSGVNDWTQRANGTFYQDLRLGNSGGQGGLIESMLWDYAFTGTENDLMALIPYCENREFTQRHTESIGDSNAQPSGQSIFGATRIDCARGLTGEVLGRERCTYVTPQYCELVQAVYGLAGQKRPILQAGGNGQFGRRTMQWQSGSEIYLDYEKRNVLGFSLDFAEDYTKSNWSMEFTWIEGLPEFNNLSYEITEKVDDFNLTVSMDRPTFVNFLNANRTFFINSQWFFNYQKGWDESFASIGPWNVLATFAVFTGYFQDRLNPTLVFVYDFRSRSGGALPQINYRFSENFSITVGASLFAGEQGLTDMPLNPIAPAGPRAGANAYMDGTEPGLSLVRDRDEVWMTLRYTF